jgi:hypothetical protein
MAELSDFSPHFSQLGENPYFQFVKCEPTRKALADGFYSSEYTFFGTE